MHYKLYPEYTKYIVHLLVLIGFVLQMPLSVCQIACMCHPFGCTPGALALQKFPWPRSVFCNLDI